MYETATGQTRESCDELARARTWNNIKRIACIDLSQFNEGEGL